MMVSRLGIDSLQDRFNSRNFSGRHDAGSVQADQFLARIAKHAAHAGIRIQVIALAVGDEDAIWRGIEESAVASLAGAPGLFGAFAAGDVAGHFGDANYFAG